MSIPPRSGGLRWLAQAATSMRDAIERKAPPHGPRGSQAAGTRQAGSLRFAVPRPMAAGVSMPKLPQGVQSLLDGLAKGGLPLSRQNSARPAPSAAPDGAQFLAAAFSGPAGSRPYKLYVPSSYRGEPVPLVVMLHGCTQAPDDFAAGTRMNALAEEHACLVAYPEQTAAAHGQRCWNWYDASHQRRADGEPAIIAGITRQVMRDYAVDPSRVFVAGLSAGGAAAAIMGATHPDLYAAVGVHSGLACGAATSLNAALTAMRQGAVGRVGGQGARAVPAIVFHGDRDTTVHPDNGDAVVAQLSPAGSLRTRVESGQVPGGHAYQRRCFADADGQVVLEQWVVHGAGHAWSGGDPAGSYTDPRGPDASREMLRFFLSHPHPAPSR